jgi:hypothetical protein
MEDFCTKLEAVVSEPVKDLKIEDLSINPEAMDTDPVRDLKRDVFSAKPELEPMEALSALPMSLA